MLVTSIYFKLGNQFGHLNYLHHAQVAMMIVLSQDVHSETKLNLIEEGGGGGDPKLGIFLICWWLFFWGFL